MGKNAKDHRKKVEARNQARKNDQKKQMKFREEWLKALIEREKASGRFDNVPPAITDQNQVIGAPAPTLTEIQGPII